MRDRGGVVGHRHGYLIALLSEASFRVERDLTLVDAEPLGSDLKILMRGKCSECCKEVLSGTQYFHVMVDKICGINMLASFTVAQHVSHRMLRLLPLCFPMGTRSCKTQPGRLLQPLPQGAAGVGEVLGPRGS